MDSEALPGLDVGSGWRSGGTGSGRSGHWMVLGVGADTGGCSGAGANTGGHSGAGADTGGRSRAGVDTGGHSGAGADTGGCYGPKIRVESCPFLLILLL